MITKFRITNKRNAFIAAVQSQRAQDFAIAKSRRQFKHEASDKTPYVPGQLGLSVVATAIQKEYGGILNRTGRKLLAKATRKARPRFYNYQ
ncbi:hypothetical protein [Paenibacillus donghaensis]|uniref:Uncharacterized protein n=1 Tax=Paenibacillus donghaensis TaxID=414771 RepID=A0A2Z2KIH6_9BACL|nr:hypothetical protein [Paenibacillus donghaensis]ASA22039.1 hypothetical protein B9T62_15405 [Paenibacillus donghaensis]